MAKRTIEINKTLTPVEWILLVILSVLWGFAFIFTSIAIKELPTLTIVVLRVSLAAIILLGLHQLLGLKIHYDTHKWASYFCMGLLNNAIPFSLIAWGQMHIAAALAAILNATTPIITVMIAHFFTLDEKMTVRRLGGTILGFLGVIVILSPEAAFGFSMNLTAQLACLLAAVFYACAGVFGRRFKDIDDSPITTATGQLMASTILLLPIALIVDKPWDLLMPGWHTWGAIVGAAVFSTAFAYVIYFRILSTAGATNILLVTFLIPVSTIILGALLLGESLKFNHFIGLVFIGLGLFSIDGRLPYLFFKRYAILKK